MSRVRPSHAHTAEADVMLADVAREARKAGLARLERLATTELGG
jgi:hypothetical protein